MSTTHNTSNGRRVSMESLRLENEHVITVGNTKTNARGDSLGPGGVPQATKQQAINEYYNLHTPVTGGKPTHLPHAMVNQPAVLREQQFDAPSADPLIEEQDALTEALTETTKSDRPVRGNLAGTLAKK